MPRIDMGQFGYRTPQGADRSPVAGFDPTPGNAAMGLGQQVAESGLRLVHQAQQIESEEVRRAREADERAAQARVSLAHVNIQNGLADEMDALNRDVLAGKESDKIAATDRWAQNSQKLIDQQLAGLPADRAGLVAAQAKGLQSRLRNGLFDTFAKRDEQDAIAAVYSAEEGLQRYAMRDPASAIQQHSMLIDGSPLAPELKAKRKQTFVEGVHYNVFRQAGQAAFQADSIEGLDAAQRRLAGPEGDAIDPAKRNSLDQFFFGLKTQIQTKRDRAAARADKEQERAENRAIDGLNSMGSVIESGALVSPDLMQRTVQHLTDAGSPPELLQKYRGMMEAQTEGARFMALPAAQRTDAMDMLRTDRQDPAKGATPQSEKRLQRLERMDSEARRRVDDGDAWGAAASSGALAQPVQSLSPEALQNPTAIQGVVQERMQQISAVETWAGKKVSPLQPAEAAAVGQVLRALKPDQAASMLGTLGGFIGDPDRIAALGKQLGDKDKTLGMAMLYANAKTTLGRYTAEAILLGQQAIRDKTVKADGAAETGWRATIAQQVRGAYSNREVEDSMVDAAFLIMAGRAKDETLKDTSIEKAIELATGGITERNGVKVPRPYGMTEKDFTKRLDSLSEADLRDQAPNGVVFAGSHQIPLAEFVKSLPQAKLKHAGQGVYNVTAGQQLVTDGNGRRISIKVGP